MQTLIGIFQWTVAIVSVVGALALFTWVAMLFFRKDRKDESPGNGR